MSLIIKTVMSDALYFILETLNQSLTLQTCLWIQAKKLVILKFFFFLA